MKAKFRVGDIIKQKRRTVSEVVSVNKSQGKWYYSVKTVSGVGSYSGSEVCAEEEIEKKLGEL